MGLATLWQTSPSHKAIRNHTPSFPPKAKACTRSRLATVHARHYEPGRFRFTANGETVVRLSEERLGYTHKGIESLLMGSTAEAAERLCLHPTFNGFF